MYAGSVGGNINVMKKMFLLLSKKVKSQFKSLNNFFFLQKYAVVFVPFKTHKRAQREEQQVSSNDCLLLWKQGAQSAFFFFPE